MPYQATTLVTEVNSNVSCQLRPSQDGDGGHVERDQERAQMEDRLGRHGN